MASKQQAPPPPTGGFTGYVPNPTLKERWQQHRAQRRAQPKRPIVQIVTTAPAPRRKRATRLSRGGLLNVHHPTARRARRRPPRRGALFGVFSVIVASVVLTAAVVEFASWTTATVVFTAAEGVSAGTAWFFGDPNPRPKAPPRPKQPRGMGPPPKPKPSGGHLCGVLTQGGKGAPCQRPVAKAGAFCFDHPGGKSSATPKATGKPSGGPKKTKKAAPPPTPNP